MTETLMRTLSNQQRLHLVNSEQLFENYRAALRQHRAYRYGMRWKRVRGVEYLFREHDRRGNGKLLGRRSAETEARHCLFHEGKAAAKQRLADIKAKLDEQARLNKALRLGRVPRVVARILRALDGAGLGEVFTVLGTQALYGYEALAGAQLLAELLASGDVDLLYDTRQKLTLVSLRLEGQGLLGLLKQADRSFECVRRNSFRAANAGQFMVELVIAPRPLHHTEPVTFADNDLVAAEVPGLQWLLNVPPLEVIAIDEQGWPVPFRVPDPRAFAFHKLWLSRRVDREPVKKPRDLAQACAVAQLIRDELPQWSLAMPLTALPKDIADVGALEASCGLADLMGKAIHDINA